jgi:hypoxanthine phosphoribosyltransferase
MTVSLVDLLNIKSVASIGVKFYTGVNQRLAQPEIYQALPVAVKTENILLFDDVADTGESLKFVTEHLLKIGAATVTTATLLYKPHSKLKPDFYSAETSTWIIFPYDLVESVTNLGMKWQKAGLSVSEIELRLQQFGFKPNWLRPYTQTLIV